MTVKQKEIQMMMPLFTGKKVNVWTQRDFLHEKEPFCDGTVQDFTGTYLILKWVTIWNGVWEDEKMISIGTIKKIELKA